MDNKIKAILNTVKGVAKKYDIRQYSTDINEENNIIVSLKVDDYAVSQELDNDYTDFREMRIAVLKTFDDLLREILQSYYFDTECQDSLSNIILLRHAAKLRSTRYHLQAELMKAGFKPDTLQYYDESSNLLKDLHFATNDMIANIKQDRIFTNQEIQAAVMCLTDEEFIKYYSNIKEGTLKNLALFKFNPQSDTYLKNISDLRSLLFLYQKIRSIYMANQYDNGLISSSDAKNYAKILSGKNPYQKVKELISLDILPRPMSCI